MDFMSVVIDGVLDAILQNPKYVIPALVIMLSASGILMWHQRQKNLALRREATRLHAVVSLLDPGYVNDILLAKALKLERADAQDTVTFHSSTTARPARLQAAEDLRLARNEFEYAVHAFARCGFRTFPDHHVYLNHHRQTIKLARSS